MEQTPFLMMNNICKSFPGVQALKNVDFDLRKSEVHCILGENGAGKSTLIKVLSGALREDSGTICIDGQAVILDSPRKAHEVGFATIYQEFNLCPNLSVAANIFLGEEERFKKKGLIDRAGMRNKAKEYLNKLGVEVSPIAKVSSLTVAQQQVVEISKALSRGARVIIMDEPTAALSGEEVVKLFGVIRYLKENGVSIVYISHRLDEIFEIGDRITVLRDGAKVRTLESTTEISREELVALMVGRKIEDWIPKVKTEKGKEILKVSNLNRDGVFHDINFSLYEGEVLGFSGLVGSGRTEVMRAIFGADPYDEGTIWFDGQELKKTDPSKVIKSGMYLLPENRKDQGLVLLMPVSQNITLSRLSLVSNIFKISGRKERAAVQRYKEELNIRTPSIRRLAKFLSGGNQQKCVVAKSLFSKSKLLIFDEPTRGIDVGAKAEIYDLINNLVVEGIGVIIVSSELPEILGLCDRIIVMRDRTIVGEVQRERATQELVMKLALGEGD
jgi:ribose transport system ATP-binding protein